MDLSGAAVGVLQPGHINLGEVAEGDLDEASGITGGGDTVGRTGRDPDLLADGGVPRVPIDLDEQAGIQDDPQFATLMVVLEAVHASGTDRHQFHRSDGVPRVLHGTAPFTGFADWVGTDDRPEMIGGIVWQWHFLDLIP